MRAHAALITTWLVAIAVPASAATYTVKLGDTLDAIAGRLGVSSAELASANDLADPNRILEGQVLDVPGQPAKTETQTPTETYVVRRGDTLSSIAARFEVSTNDLVRLNDLSDPNRIGEGETLIVRGDVNGRDISAYRHLGAWVDVFDYSPAFADGSTVPQLTPASVDRMASAGIRTLYIQASVDSSRSSGLVEAPTVLSAFVTRAHAKGMRVVAWYLPTFKDINADLARLRAIRDFRAGQRGFDGVAVDIEWTDGIPDATRRNAALIELSRRFRAETNTAIGAIVLPPVLLEVVNTDYWPRFPWKALAPYYDVWLPMAYWTDRTVASGYRDPRRNTAEYIARIRTDLADPDAAVHVIGGIGGTSTADEYRRFAAAAREGNAVGISLYDYRVTAASVWPILARG
jgi:LysM repeat protein